MTTFEEFALDHNKHVHCRGCNGCILDPTWFVQQFENSVWCVACRDRIKKNNPPDKKLPWLWHMEINPTSEPGADK